MLLPFCVFLHGVSPIIYPIIYPIQVKKNPGVDTSFLPDEQREKRDEELREELKQKVCVCVNARASTVDQ